MCYVTMRNLIIGANMGDNNNGNKVRTPTPYHHLHQDLILHLQVLVTDTVVAVVVGTQLTKEVSTDRQ